MPGSWDGKTRPSNEKYRKNFEEIFGQKEKEELELSMKSSRHQEYVRKEMDKIRKEGKIKDLYEIINEAERRVNKNV
jgi:predicted RNA-binding protein